MCRRCFALEFWLTKSSQWFGQELTDVAKPVHEDIPCTNFQAVKSDWTWVRATAQFYLNQDIKKRKARAAKSKHQSNVVAKASGKEFRSRSRIIRLAATIPMLPSLIRTGSVKISDFTSKAILNNQWYDAKYNQSPYRRHLDSFSQNNMKFDKLETVILSKLKADEKIIILSSFPAIAFIVYLVSYQFPVVYLQLIE